MRSYDHARLASTIGIACSYTLNCKMLTPRIRNPVIRALESGFSKGGYSSKSAKVVEALSEAFEIPMMRSSRWGVSGKNLHPDLVPTLTELVNASKTAARMRGENEYALQRYQLYNNGYHGAWTAQIDSHYYDQVADATKKIVEADEDYQAKVRPLLDALRTGDTIEFPEVLQG